MFKKIWQAAKWLYDNIRKVKNCITHIKNSLPLNRHPATELLVPEQNPVGPE